MTENSTKHDNVLPRDASNWAQQTDDVRLSGVPLGARNVNVEGKQAVGPLQGFGPMWQKTYRVRLVGSDATPKDVISTWKKHFPDRRRTGSSA